MELGDDSKRVVENQTSSGIAWCSEYFHLGTETVNGSETLPPSEPVLVVRLLSVGEREASPSSEKGMPCRHSGHNVVDLDY
ncbi:uncharacterized protein ARMOST_02200 [Armillaria ostoyae]|uniref:Uncharacterized protein n=1 Tax=Armillaria ostoyae TaxID=47428 RepID=A0A284QR21_ARMOS|nr:uncharacterized protein ARMOST_02200 [Armillaria ostoyae]